MKKGAFGIIVSACIMLIFIWLNTIGESGAKGSYAFALITSSLILAYLIAKTRKKKIDKASNRKMAFEALAMVILAYISSIYLPYLIAIAIVSIFMGISEKYFSLTLKKAILKQEGI